MATAKHLFHAHETIRKCSNERELPAQVQAIFLLIASSVKNPSQKEIAAKIGITNSSVSRGVSWLGKQHRRPNRAGLRWIEEYQCPQDWRAKRYKLTALGRQVIKEALAAPRPPRQDWLSDEALREAINAL